MTRLRTAIRGDLTLQLRNGFYAATVLVTGVWIALLAQAGSLALGRLLPPLLVGNLLVGTFFFLGGQVLLEKGEGTLTAQGVTPLRPAEYLAAKVLTLTALGLGESLTLLPWLGRGPLQLPLLLVGLAGAGAIYCLAGFLAVAPYQAITEYLLPAGLYVGALWLPLIAALAGWPALWFAWHPLAGPLALIAAASGGRPVDGGLLLYGSATVGWIALLAAACGRAFRRQILARGTGD
jgi:fluoroquinolone transport system permease protein